jgi:hypothetical protein
MRRRAILIILLIWWAKFFVQSAGAEDPQRPATDAYEKQVGAIAFQSIVPKFGKHSERLEEGGIVNAMFRLGKDTSKNSRFFQRSPTHG